MNLGVPSWLSALALLFISQVSECDCDHGNAAECKEGQTALCGVDTPECSGWVKTCKDGKWGECGTWVAEQCDGRDNDCDGAIDETPQFPLNACNQQRGGVCLTIEPVCEQGVVKCRNPPEYQATEIRCDGRDNDCDGQTDEPIPSPSLPPCAEIPNSRCPQGEVELLCVAGGGDVREAVCSTYLGGRFYQGRPESCTPDGVDEDCNGQIDDDTHCRPDCDPLVVITTEADLADCRGSTFSRPSPAQQLSYHGAPGQAVLVTRDEHLVRWEYAPELVGLPEAEKKALLLEGHSVNLIKHSMLPYNDVSRAFKAPWVREGADLNGSLLPDPASPSLNGKITRLTVARNRGYQSLWQSVPNTDPIYPNGQSELYSSSFWLKKGTLTDCQLFYQNTAPDPYPLTIPLPLPLTWSRFVAPYPPDQAGRLINNLDMVLGLECNAGIGTDKYLDVYGFQLEKLRFSSSFIPNDDGQNFRAADVLELPADLLEPAQGSYFVWLRPEYLPTEVDLAGYPLLRAGQFLEVRMIRDAGATYATCRSGTREAQVLLLDQDWSRGQWIFVACVWTGPAMTAYYFDGEQKSASSAAGVPAAADQLGPLRPAPVWALSRDIRIYQTARTEAELQEFLDQTRATYGY